MGKVLVIAVGAIIVLIFVMVTLSIVGFTFVAFNKLRKADILAQEALGGIDVQLNRRADLIPNLTNTVKGYASHEKDIFEEVTARERLPRPSGRGKRAVSPGAADFRCTGAHALEDSAEVVDVLGVQHFVPVLRHEDQVDMWC